MTKMLSVVFYFAILAILFAIIIVIRKLFKKLGKNTNKQYDEMQLLIISRAYKIAYFSLVIMLILVILIDVNIGNSLPSGAISQFLSWPIMISVTIFFVYTIWHDAFFVPGQSWRNYIIHCVFLILLFGYSFIGGIKEGVSGPVNALSIGEYALFRNGTSASFFTTFLITAIAIVIKMIKNKNEAAEGED